MLTSGTRAHHELQSEKTHGIKCGTFGASSIEERHLATGDYGGVLNIWYWNERCNHVRHVRSSRLVSQGLGAVGCSSVQQPSAFEHCECDRWMWWAWDWWRSS